MPYVKIENNIVVQKQQNKAENFVGVDTSIVCGMEHDGSSEYGVANFSTPVYAPDWDDVRRKRNGALRSSDWTQASDSPLYGDIDWISYRADLRNITDDYATPEDVVWPSKP